VSEEFPYLLRKLEYWGTTFNNASLTTKAAQLRRPSPERNVSSRYISGFAKSPTLILTIAFLLALSVSGGPKKNVLTFNGDADSCPEASNVRKLGN